jgi:hypothetical protein
LGAFQSSRERMRVVSVDPIVLGGVVINDMTVEQVDEVERIYEATLRSLRAREQRLLRPWWLRLLPAPPRAPGKRAGSSSTEHRARRCRLHRHSRQRRRRVARRSRETLIVFAVSGHAERGRRLPWPCLRRCHAARAPSGTTPAAAPRTASSRCAGCSSARSTADRSSSWRILEPRWRPEITHAVGQLGLVGARASAHASIVLSMFVERPANRGRALGVQGPTARSSGRGRRHGLQASRVAKHGRAICRRERPLPAAARVLRVERAGRPPAFTTE